MSSPRSAQAVQPSLRGSEERFIRINRERLRRIHEALNTRQRDFLELIPLLFHTNHPLLPGYVSQNTPCGVRDYKPTQETLSAAQRVTRAYKHDRRVLRRLDVLGLYMMGSCGTIAYTPGSDFDIWLCHSPDLDPNAINELRDKATHIEQAAIEVDLDVHFFVFDPNGFRRGELSTLSAESSGSSQHYLLLDEFYRSAVVLAGLYPLWWRVPPEKEREYATFSSQLLQQRHIGRNDYIDFGGLERIPAEEFFGAAVWHIYKSINSPYKSVLKLLLIEAYAQEYPDIDLLALNYKRLVFDGEANLNAIDPYILMYRKVEDYLSKRGESERLNLFRRCFYFKIEEKLSRPSRADDSWRREALQDLVQNWGWDTGQLLLLDSRDQWKVPIVLEQRRDLIAALTQSYRLLSLFGREQADSARISQRDLHILGRKLYAAFERKAGKIDIVNRGIAPDITEARITLHQVGDNGSADSWLLFTNAVAPEEIGQYPAIRRSTGIVDLLAWCHFNRIIGEQTIVAGYATGQPAAVREIRATLNALGSAFPDGTVCNSGSVDLTRPPRIVRGVLFVNVGTDHLTGARGSDLITSNRTDPLSFGGLRNNLTQCLDLVLMTSWEEVFTFHYRGLDGLLSCLCEYLRLRVASADLPESFTTHCFATGHGASISKRFEQLFDDISRCLLEGGSHWRYVFEASDHYYAIIRDEGGIHSEKLGAHSGLMNFLARPQTRFVRTHIDRYALLGDVLPLLYSQNREDTVQTFFRMDGKDVEVLVLDERGCLFTQTMQFQNPHILLDHLARFYRSTSQRIALLSQPDGKPWRMTFEFKRIVTNNRREHALENIAYNADLGRRYLQIKVVVENQEDRQPEYLIHCENREFSSLSHGNDLFEVVARHVLSLRKDGTAYPIYITDLDVPTLQTPGDAGTTTQTARLLDYKRAFEDRLNQTLNDLSATTSSTS